MEQSKTLFAIVRDAMRCIESAFDDALAPLGIDAVDFEILLALEEEGRWSIVSLARSMRSNRTALSKRVARLEARGLLVVNRTNQRRSRTSLTGPGREVLAEAMGPHDEVHAELELRLGDGTAAVLAHFSDRFRRVPFTLATRCADPRG